MTSTASRPSTARHLWTLIRYRPYLYLFTAAAWVAVEAAPIVPGLILREFFNTLMDPAQGRFSVTVLAAAVLGFALARAVLTVIGFAADTRFRSSVSALLRTNLLLYVLQRAPADQAGTQVGDALSRIKDDVNVIEISVDWVLDTIGKLVFSLLALGIMWHANAAVTLALLTLLLVVLLRARLSRAAVETARQRSRAAARDVSALLADTFASIQAVQAASAETRILQRLKVLGDQRQAAAVHDQVLTARTAAAYQTIVNAGAGGVLILAALFVRQGTMTVGDVALFIYYLTFVTGFIEFFGTFMTQYTQAGVAFDRLTVLTGGNVEALMQRWPLDGQYPDTADQPWRAPDLGPLVHLELAGLTYTFPGTQRGIKDVSLDVRAAELIVVTGRVGAGKSTLLRTALGQLPAQGGEVRWNGEQLANPGTVLQPPNAAFVPQVPHLLSLTVEDNILLGAPEQELDRAVQLGTFEHDVSCFPMGAQTPVGTNGAKLSGGQQQRLAAARAFAQRASLHVLDDLSSGLDAHTEALLWQRLRQEGMTVLAASQKRVAFEQADRIVVLRDGQVHACGTAKQLLDTCEEFRQLWAQAAPQVEQEEVG